MKGREGRMEGRDGEGREMERDGSISSNLSRREREEGGRR